MQDDHLYTHIRETITRRYNARTEFFGHLIAFVAFNLIVWWGLHPVDGTLVSLLSFIGAVWFMGLAIHAVNYLMTELRERAIQRALQHERHGAAFSPVRRGARKRKHRPEIVEDGDLFEGELLPEVHHLSER